MNFSNYYFVCVPNFERLILVLIEQRTVDKSDELAQVMFPICSAQVQIVFHAAQTYGWLQLEQAGGAQDLRVRVLFVAPGDKTRSSQRALCLRWRRARAQPPLAPCRAAACRA